MRPRRWFRALFRISEGIFHMFRLTLSNRFEFLLETCSNVSRARTCSPLTAQQVIIPSTAVRRRVELACADRQGICANIEFSYLAQWLWTQIGRLVEIQERVAVFAGAADLAGVRDAWRRWLHQGGIRASPATCATPTR
jgi:hypothetical protein